MHRPSLEKGVFELIIDEESSPFCLIVLILDEVTFVQLVLKLFWVSLIDHFCFATLLVITHETVRNDPARICECMVTLHR